MWNISLVLSRVLGICSLLSLTLSLLNPLSVPFSWLLGLSVLLVLVVGLVFFCFPFLSKGKVSYGLS